MELQFPHTASPSFKPAQDGLDSHQIAERLAALSDRHAVLTEKLRELHDETPTKWFAQIEWHHLEKQVVSLRFEMESLKNIFQVTENSSDIIVLADLLEF